MAAKYIADSHSNYPKQLPYIGCGGHQLRTVFEHVKEEKLQKKFPWFMGPHKLAALCKKYQLVTNKRKKGTIDTLRTTIDNGGIPILLIGRGYNNKKTGFNPIKAMFFQHYISVRGYDDDQQLFYCYDSTVRVQENDFPIGNKVLSYTMLKRSWSRGGVGLYKRFALEISE